MAIKTLYTAVGRFERRTNGCNRSCPIILLGGQEYMVDMQEMVIWSMLNWRILRWDDIAQEYEKLSTASGYCTERSWEDCTNRLLTRGLLVSGSGETEYDALYGGAFEAGTLPVLNVLTMSLFMTTVLEYTNSLIAPIIVHFLWNSVGAIILGGVSLAEDYPHLFNMTFGGNQLLSGGIYKIEGSVVVFVLNVIMIIGFIMAKKKKNIA